MLAIAILLRLSRGDFCTVEFYDKGSPIGSSSVKQDAVYLRFQVQKVCQGFVMQVLAYLVLAQN